MGNGKEDCRQNNISYLYSLLNIQYIFLFLVFAGIMFFFTCAHPLVLYDGDDWYNISNMRSVALPKWGDWNPGKVLPETLMPLCGLFAAYVLTPLTGDYLWAVTLITAIVVSGAVTVYTGMFFCLIRKVFSLSAGKIVVVTVMFLLFHFLIFKSHQFNNPYLFKAVNLTCYYHYVIPGLLNASLVMYLMSLEFETGDFSKLNLSLRPFFLLAVYFAIFSNILLSIILISWLTVSILTYCCRDKTGMGHLSLKKRIHNNHFYGIYSENKTVFWIVVVWLISLLFEANGGRSHQIGHGLTLMSLLEPVAVLTAFIQSNAKSILIFTTAFAIFTCGAVLLKKRDRNDVQMQCSFIYRCLFAVIVWLLYMVPVSAKAGTAYIVEPNVLLGMFFYLFLIAMGAAAYIMSRWKGAYFIMLLLSICVLCRTMDGGTALANSNYGGLESDVCISVDRDIMSQIIEKQHEERMEIRVPVGNMEGNWPHPEDFAKRMAVTLYQHGQISHLPKIIVSCPDENMNRKYKIVY